KPVPPASRLVAQVAPSVASGLGLSVPAAGPARHPHYSRCGRLCEQSLLLICARLRTTAAYRRHARAALSRGRAALPVRDCHPRVALAMTRLWRTVTIS